jgi:murein DD-endopeptidase MepM/ murein hydrolase activator NlpD
MRHAPSYPVLVFLFFLLLALLMQRAAFPTDIATAAQATLDGSATSLDPYSQGGDPAWPGDLRPLDQNYVFKFPLLHTDVPDRPRRSILTYNIAAGDTIGGVARRFRITPESIVWANDSLENNVDYLKIGQEILIPPTSGVLHTVQSGDTVESIAKKYKAEPNGIIALEANNLAPPYALTAGQKVMVPGGEKPIVQKVQYGFSGATPTTSARGSGNWQWPVAGYLTQGFWSGHRAIDIGTRTGNAVWAADSGYIVFVGWEAYGYGNHIIVNHGNGYETLYAHLSVVLVTPGQSVRRGQVIGLAGSTGRSTGPHLHFEIRYLGVQRNPLNFLP